VNAATAAAAAAVAIGVPQRCCVGVQNAAIHTAYTDATNASVQLLLLLPHTACGYTTTTSAACVTTTTTDARSASSSTDTTYYVAKTDTVDANAVVYGMSVPMWRT
jgi:hypothetical protein